MNYFFSLSTMRSHLVIFSFPLLFLSNWTYCHQILAWPFSLAFANLTLSGSLISSYSKYSSSSLIQSINSSSFRFPKNTPTSIVGLFSNLLMALKSLSSTWFRTSPWTSPSNPISSSSFSSSLSSPTTIFVPLRSFSYNVWTCLWRALTYSRLIASTLPPCSLHEGIFLTQTHNHIVLVKTTAQLALCLHT